MDAGHSAADDAIDKMERKLRKVYLQAYEETEAKLQDYLNKFAAKDQIKLDQLKRGLITQDEYNYWRKGQILIGRRWQEMVNTLAEDYTNANQIAMGIVNRYTPDVYAVNHDYGTYQIEHDSMVDTSYTLYDHATVERLMRDNPDLLPRASVNIPKDLRWNKQHINNAVLQGILQGESNQKIAARLRGVTDMNKAAAIRNARTMTTGAENAGRVDSYNRARDMGIGVQQEWLATLDGRTRDSHRMLDGERIPVAKDKWHPSKFSNGCRYPGDPQGPPREVYNCRCTLVPVVEGIDQSNAPRRSKLGGMSYEEWRGDHAKTQDTGGDGRQMFGIRKTLGDAFVDAMQTLLEFTEEPHIKDVFYKYGNSLKVVPDFSMKGAYFKPLDTSVHMNPKRVADGTSVARPYQTAFHEFGHNIDWLAGVERGEGFLSSGYGDGLLAKTIKEDWENFKVSEIKKDPLRFIHRQTDEEKERTFRVLLRSSAVSEADQDLFSDLAHKIRSGETSIRAVLDNPEYGDRVARAMAPHLLGNDEAVNLVKEAAGGTIDTVAMVNVSDMVEYCTGIPCPFGAGHGLDYWTPEKGAVEFFAEVCDSKAANPASMGWMRKLFPNSVGIVEEILEVLAH